ncbi:MAG TPA: glycosyltransferase [Candidatus Paceibacterota bacterium]|nr:glycosyltransferase [Verrucomicrobiota bacterium]HRY47335.1 glycosyltransferase [Candidatus Paceibacterota bacterium]HSA03806.1 glycosyltransferase [Candidatus Paceibacterota bacterium]
MPTPLSPPPAPPKVSVIVPVYGRLGDVSRLVEILRRQTVVPHEILLVDSSATSFPSVPEGVIYLKNPRDLALSGDYNHGAQFATGDYLLLMQQDCLPARETDLEDNLKLMTPGRVAVTSSVTLPRDNWMQYNFWGQALMARWVGTYRQGISGKFDLIRAEVFRRIGGYDTENFSFAGEDMDLFMRLSEQGEVWVASTQVLHLHAQSQQTRCRDLFKKHFQLAESFGALLRKWGFKLTRIPYASHLSHHIGKFLYLFLPVFLLYPRYLIIYLVIVSNLSNLNFLRLPSARKWLFLALNPALFITGAIATTKGFITGRQRYSVNK